MIFQYRLPQFRELRKLSFSFILSGLALGIMVVPVQLQTAIAQTSRQSGDNSPLRVEGEFQEYNAKAQVGTVRGNVKLLYPARGIQATAAQAQIFMRERRIVLTGDVYVLQQGGNSIRAERIDYLIDEGRFVAAPRSGGRVESIFMLNESNNPAATPAPATPPIRPRN